MTAEAIAKVVADLKAGRLRGSIWDTHPEGQRLANSIAATYEGPTVDATDIYYSLLKKDRPVRVYEDHPCIAPPWDNAFISYQNEHGNVVVMNTHAQSYEEFMGSKASELRGNALWGGTINPVDWGRVKWVIWGFVWCGGWAGKTTGQGRAIPTVGPLHLWQFAVYESGEPADIHWVRLLDDHPMDRWDMANLVLLGALNFCNCRNVELVEPQRPRAEARRIARTGVTVKTINVFPTGRSTKGRVSSDEVGVPLTSVRGHMAHYGQCCNYHPRRGLLFGKHEGRYWIPQHARGDATLGENQLDYRLVT